MPRGQSQTKAQRTCTSPLREGKLLNPSGSLRRPRQPCQPIFEKHPAGLQVDLGLAKSQLLTVDRSARGSMKTAAKCVSACESQDYQMHRPVERTLRRRYYQVSSPLPDECLYTKTASIRRPLGSSCCPPCGGWRPGLSGLAAQWGARAGLCARGVPLNTNSETGRGGPPAPVAGRPSVTSIRPTTKGAPR